MITQPESSLKLPQGIVDRYNDTTSHNKSPAEVTDAWNKDFKVVVTTINNPESRKLPFQTSSKKFELDEFTFERTHWDTRDTMTSRTYGDRFTQSTRNEEILPVFSRPSYKDVLQNDPRYLSQNIKLENSVQTWASGYSSNGK